MSSFQPFYSENDPDESEIVTLSDEEGRSLACYVENSLEIEDATYLLLMPADLPVVIIAWEGEAEDDEELSDAILLEDREEIAEIFDDAKAVLAEQELTLKNTAFTLTVTGELPPLEDDSILTLEMDTDEEAEESEEELQWLASFYHQENKYSIYTPLEPLLFLAKYNHLGELELVSPEDEKMKTILEELLIDEFNYQD